MASFLERWEREKKRLEKGGWLTYQWEDLSQVLDPIKKDIFQKQTLLIPRFKNNEGTEVGYTYGKRKKWVGFRGRLKPFYIFKNKVMVYWKPDWNTQTKGTWEIGVYRKPNFATKHRERITRALNVELMLREQWNSFQSVRDYSYDGGPNKLGRPPSGDNTKVIEGGSVRNEVGRSQLGRTEWTDEGELKNLKSAKQMAENIWKLAAINGTYLRWMHDESIDVRFINTPLIGFDRYPYGEENQQDSSSWYDYTPFNNLSDWYDVITRPRAAYIINWTNFAPDV